MIKRKFEESQSKRGGTMKIKQTQTVTRVPGNPGASTRITSEWVCSDCDYFEEAEEESNR